MGPCFAGTERLERLRESSTSEVPLILRTGCGAAISSAGAVRSELCGPSVGCGVHSGTQYGTFLHTLYVTVYDSIRHVVTGTRVTTSLVTVRQVTTGTWHTRSSLIHLQRWHFNTCVRSSGIVLQVW